MNDDLWCVEWEKSKKYRGDSSSNILFRHSTWLPSAFFLLFCTSQAIICHFQMMILDGEAQRKCGFRRTLCGLFVNFNCFYFLIKIAIFFPFNLVGHDLLEVIKYYLCVHIKVDGIQICICDEDITRRRRRKRWFCHKM